MTQVPDYSKCMFAKACHSLIRSFVESQWWIVWTAHAPDGVERRSAELHVVEGKLVPRPEMTGLPPRFHLP